MYIDTHVIHSIETNIPKPNGRNTKRRMARIAKSETSWPRKVGIIREL